MVDSNTLRVVAYCPDPADAEAVVHLIGSAVGAAVAARAKLLAVLQAWGDRFDLATHAEWEELVKRTLADVTGRAAGAA